MLGLGSWQCFSMCSGLEWLECSRVQFQSARFSRTFSPPQHLVFYSVCSEYNKDYNLVFIWCCMLCAVLWCTILSLYYDMLYHDILWYTILYYDMLYYDILYYHYTMICYHYTITLYYDILYYHTIPWCTILWYTIPSLYYNYDILYHHYTMICHHYTMMCHYHVSCQSPRQIHVLHTHQQCSHTSYQLWSRNARARIARVSWQKVVFSCSSVWRAWAMPSTLTAWERVRHYVLHDGIGHGMGYIVWCRLYHDR